MCLNHSIFLNNIQQSENTIKGDFMKKLLSAVFGVLIGFINGTVGAGGGLIAVPLIKSFGTELKESHSTAIAVLFPITIASTLTYINAGHVSFADASPYILPSVIGAAAGTVLMTKISTEWLKKIFALFMLYAGVRLLLR